MKLNNVIQTMQLLCNAFMFIFENNKIPVHQTHQKVTLTFFVRKDTRIHKTLFSSKPINHYEFTDFTLAVDPPDEDNGAMAQNPDIPQIPKAETLPKIGNIHA